MGLDIKIPIGLMFALFGAILTIFGLVTADSAMYELSLGKNINLWSGLFMLGFGAFMLILSKLSKAKKE